MTIEDAKVELKDYFLRRIHADDLKMVAKLLNDPASEFPEFRKLDLKDFVVDEDTLGLALYVAASKCSSEMMEFLIMRGVDVNYADKQHGLTALMGATTRHRYNDGFEDEYKRRNLESLKIMRLLLQNKANVNAQDKISGETALLRLIHSDREEDQSRLKLLLEFQADHNFDERGNYWGLSLSERFANPKMLAILKQHEKQKRAGKKPDPLRDMDNTEFEIEDDTNKPRKPIRL